MKSSEIKTVLSAHNDYWEQRRLEMIAYGNAYNKKMFTNSQATQLVSGENDVVVETNDGYAVIESYLSSLFPKSPSVVITQDTTGGGDASVAQAIANRFLFDKFSLIEQGLRFSLIYPFSAWKLGISEKTKMIDSVDVKPLLPWDLLLDQNSTRWENQRFIGHRYYLPLSEAKERFGNKDFTGTNKVDYLENSMRSGKTANYVPYDSYKISTTNATKSGGQTTLFTYVEILEFYDFQNDELTFYSPNLKTNDGILESVSPIPFRDADGSAVAPICPMFMGTDPETPLKGNSTMGRIYSQLWEINSIRTFFARAVRKATRVYLVRKGVLDEESKANISLNIDNSVVEIDAPYDQAISTIIQPLQNIGLEGDFYNYSNQVRSDLDRGGILAPFTRGSPTQNATATEISAMSVYAQTEIGRLARFRDEAIERLAEFYLMFIRILLETKPATAKPEVIVIEGEKKVLTTEDLDASFRIVALDQGATPISAAAKKQRLIELAPLLLQLGLPQDALLEQVIRDFELPITLLEKARGPEQQAGAGSPTNQPPAKQPVPEPQAEVPIGGGSVAEELRNQAGFAG